MATPNKISPIQNTYIFTDNGIDFLSSIRENSNQNYNISIKNNNYTFTSFENGINELFDGVDSVYFPYGENDTVSNYHGFNYIGFMKKGNEITDSTNITNVFILPSSGGIDYKTMQNEYNYSNSILYFPRTTQDEIALRGRNDGYMQNAGNEAFLGLIETAINKAYEKNNVSSNTVIIGASSSARQAMRYQYELENNPDVITPKSSTVVLMEPAEIKENYTSAQFDLETQQLYRDKFTNEKFQTTFIHFRQGGLLKDMQYIFAENPNFIDVKVDFKYENGGNVEGLKKHGLVDKLSSNIDFGQIGTGEFDLNNLPTTITDEAGIKYKLSYTYYRLNNDGIEEEIGVEEANKLFNKPILPSEYANFTKNDFIVNDSEYIKSFTTKLRNNLTDISSIKLSDYSESILSDSINEAIITYNDGIEKIKNKTDYFINTANTITEKYVNLDDELSKKIN